MKQVFIQPAARKVLRKMLMNTAQRILKKINGYAADPASQANNVIALTGTDGIRLRVGDWRIITHDGAVLDVLKVGPRGGVYD